MLIFDPKLSGPVPPSDYNVTIVAAKEVVTKAGNPALRFTVEVEPGRPTFYHFTSFTPKSIWMIEQMLTAFGMDVSELLEIDPDDFVGRSVRVRLECEEVILSAKRKKRQNKIVAWLPAETSQPDSENALPNEEDNGGETDVRD